MVIKKKFVIFVLILLLAGGCNNSTIASSKESPSYGESVSLDTSVSSLEQPLSIPNNLCFHTSIQSSFINGPLEEVNLYANGVEELSKPLDTVLEWSSDYKNCDFYLSENQDYSNPIIYHTDSNSLSLTNFKISTQYYYYLKSGDVLLKKGSFKTSNEIIRNLNISGVTNARDLGGYPLDNGFLNQNILFRTGKLNKDLEDTVTNLITEDGINTMLNYMGVKTEIDLRYIDNNEVGGLTEGVGVLGNRVKYYQCPMDYYPEMDGDFNNESLRKVFSILGDKSNYPAFFHCSIGTDRTGYVAYLINGFLGVKEEYLWRDYLFSNFGNIGDRRTKDNIIDGYIRIVGETEGNTLQEKITNYLLNRGIKQTDLNTIREMMVSNSGQAA